MRLDERTPRCQAVCWSSMVDSPYEALARLQSMVATGGLGSLCVRHGVDLLVVHGSVLDDEPLQPAQDLDLAFRCTRESTSNVVALTNDLLDAAAFDDVDLMDLRRADPVARARALAPRSEILYEAAPGLFTTAQTAAITMEMETRRLRRLDLALMAER